MSLPCKMLPHGCRWGSWIACGDVESVLRAPPVLDPPLWTVVPNKALSLSLSLAPILQGLFPPFRGELCDVTESAILGGWYRGVTVRV